MWPFSRKEASQGVKHIVPPLPPQYHPGALNASGLRKGMWLRDPEGRVGILVGLNELNIADVMLVKPDGTNLLRVSFPADALRQASIDDIPAPRRPTPEHGAAFGYVKRGQ